MTNEALLVAIRDANHLKQAAEFIEPYWEDDYGAAIIKSGRKDYSILDHAFDVVSDNLNSNSFELGKETRDILESRFTRKDLCETCVMPEHDCCDNEPDCACCRNTLKNS